MLAQNLNLPNSVPQLHGLVSDLHKKLEDFSQRERQYIEREKQYEIEIDLLRQQNKLLALKIYGRKSEKLLIEADSPQGILFADIVEKSNSCEDEGKQAIVVKTHARKRKGRGPGRRPLPENLPRKEVVHDVAEKEKLCGCGCKMVRIGEDSCEQLEMEPPRFFVKRQVRPRYACKSCGGLDSKEGEPSVKIAPLPKQLIPKSFCSGSLLSHIAVSKFADSVPLYRQEQQFKRYGIELTRGTMSNWLLKVWRKCKPLEDLLAIELLFGSLIGVDETRIQVLKEKGRAPSSKSFMWVFRGQGRAGPVYYYHYHPSRSGDVAGAVLKGYKGCVQTDGYVGYDFLDNWPGVVHAGCWAHVRRKFMEVRKALGKKKSNSKADKMLALIGKLYRIEQEAEGLSIEELCAKRKKESKPIVEEFELILREISLSVLPESLLGKAVFYSLNQLSRLKVFLDNGVIPLDNNLVENAVRPFAVGRKNWLFSYHADGARASAFYYSLIETAKANGFEPYQYLRYVFEQLPDAETAEDYKKLLPQYVDESQLPKSEKSS